jgi:uncharacterized membrane protein YkoI
MRSALRRRAGSACLVLLLAASSHVTVSTAQESLVREAISQDAAVAMVREQTHGRVVRVARKEEGGKLVYRIRVVTPDGRLRDYRVDATTGEIR